jgi:sulfite exporter TauE/SafE
MASDAIQQQEARTEQAGQSVATRERRSRILYAIAAIGILLYFANVAVGLGAAKLGWKVARLSDVWEFLTVLVSMIFFVAGLLAAEGQRPDEPPNH